MQEVNPDAKRVNQPTQFDVLFGRGKPYQGHTGNIRLHKVVELYKPRYCQARRHEKTEIAEEIVQFIKNGGGNKAGRFLKREEGQECWVEVSDAIARDKVSHALRGKPRKETSALAKEHLKEELAAAKRTLPSESSQLPAKRLKVPQSAAATELELLAAQRASSVFPSFNTTNHLLAAASNGYPSSLDLQSNLLASALAERSLGLGGPAVGQFRGYSQLLGGGSLLSPHLLSSDLSLLQGLRAEQALRADPRFWM